MRVTFSSQPSASLRLEPVRPRLTQPGTEAAGLAGDIEMPGPVAGLHFEPRPVQPVDLYAVVARASRDPAVQAKVDLVA